MNVTPLPVVEARDAARDVVIAAHVEKAEDYDSRRRGLLGRDSLPPGHGMWLIPCPMIHTFFMRFAIDVVFLDKELRVARVIEDMKPWRLSPWVLRSRSVLELPAGTLKGSLKAGDRIEMRSR